MFDFIDSSVILFYSFVIFSSKDWHISPHRTLFYVPFSNLGAFSPLFHSLQLCFYLPHADIYISCCFRETKRSKIIWVSLFFFQYQKSTYLGWAIWQCRVFCLIIKKTYIISQNDCLVGTLHGGRQRNKHRESRKPQTRGFSTRRS